MSGQRFFWIVLQGRVSEYNPNLSSFFDEVFSMSDCEDPVVVLEDWYHCGASWLYDPHLYDGL